MGIGNVVVPVVTLVAGTVLGWKWNTWSREAISAEAQELLEEKGEDDCLEFLEEFYEEDVASGVMDIMISRILKEQKKREKKLRKLKLRRLHEAEEEEEAA
jgi:hypothetical protein